MKDKPSEWVSISDLMAGVMAVVMLLLVVSVLQNQFAELKRQEEKNKSVITEQELLSGLLQDMQKALADQGDAGLVSFDLAGGKITLGDKMFARGSACVTDEAHRELTLLSPKIAAFIDTSSQSQILVEGHTDNIQVSRPVTDFAKYCTVYDDNFTLSAARAREARKLLIEMLGVQQAKRVIVAGYGDSQPLPNMDPSDERNRRVEVQFLKKSESQHPI